MYDVQAALEDDGSKMRGVGKDAPIFTNEAGGQQSALEYRFDLMPPLALAAVAQILDYGTRVRGYPEWNWLKIEAKSHLNHALMHINAHLAGDTQDEHAEHAACRIMMWLEMVIRSREREVELDKFRGEMAEMVSGKRKPIHPIVPDIGPAEYLPSEFGKPDKGCPKSCTVDKCAMHIDNHHEVNHPPCTERPGYRDDMFREAAEIEADTGI